MEIRNLELTEEDFALIIDGLDALPEKGAAGELMGDIPMGVLGKDNPDDKDKIKRERDIQKAEKARSQHLLKENIRILQGKLLLLKRWLQTEGALKQTYDTLNQNPLK